jgi:hypothetical protein
MVSGDVFRTPADSLSLAVHIGTGTQLCLASVATLIFAALGVCVGGGGGCTAAGLLLGG